MKAIADARRRRYSRHLRGRGLEIGALGNPMPLPFADEVLYSDVLRPEQIDALYPGSRHPDILSDSERFDGVASGELDFVVANHVLEHVTDPIGAVIEWHRILRPGGLLLISLPDKRYTFDHRRARTPLAHLEADHGSTADPQVRNECHLLEWAEHVEGLQPGSAEFEAWIADQKRHGFAVHNHVWVLQDILALLAHVRARYGVALRLVRWSNTSFLGNEFNLLLQKAESDWRWSAAKIAALAIHPVHELVSRARRRLVALPSQEQISSSVRSAAPHAQSIGIDCDQRSALQTVLMFDDRGDDCFPMVEGKGSSTRAWRTLGPRA